MGMNISHLPLLFNASWPLSLRLTYNFSFLIDFPHGFHYTGNGITAYASSLLHTSDRIKHAVVSRAFSLNI
jgi:hypothetical protein